MRYLFLILGYAFCILPAAVCTIEHFPLWMSDGRQGFSAIALVLIALACVPLWRLLKDRLRSPSAWMLWLAAFVLLTLFRSIIDGLWMIALIALCGSVIGAVFFAIAKRMQKTNS